MEQILKNESLISAILDSRKPIKILNEILEKKHDINFTSLLAEATYNDNIDIIEWIFLHKNEIFPNIDIEKIKRIMEENGAILTEEHYEILLNNGYKNYKVILYEEYKNYPNLINRIVEFIPNKIQKVKKFPKTGEEMVEYIDNNNMLDCFPLTTLQHIISKFIKNKYKKDNEIRINYEKSKDEPRYECNEYLKCLINDYSSEDLSLSLLCNGLIKKDTWNYLDDRGKQIFALIYDVEPTFENIFSKQSEIVNDKKLFEQFDDTMFVGLY